MKRRYLRNKKDLERFLAEEKIRKAADLVWYKKQDEIEAEWVRQGNKVWEGDETPYVDPLSAKFQ